MEKSERQVEQLVSFFQALADVTRLKLVGMLAQREQSVEELATALEVRQPTVSHHLAKLRLLGMVRLRKEGQVHYYSLDEQSVQSMARQVLSKGGLAELVPQHGADAWEQKVMQSFFDQDGRLKEIPAQRKKRDVVLRRLVREFAPDRRYTEFEVNETLKRFHPDVATLRREFIMTGLMAREPGEKMNLYWRLSPKTE
jgi:predicted transcriptional regulator